MRILKRLYDFYISCRQGRDRHEDGGNPINCDLTKVSYPADTYDCGDGLQAEDIDRIFYELNRGEQDGQKHEEWQHSKEHSKQLEGKVQEEMPRNEVS